MSGEILPPASPPVTVTFDGGPTVGPKLTHRHRTADARRYMEQQERNDRAFTKDRRAWKPEARRALRRLIDRIMRAESYSAGSVETRIAGRLELAARRGGERQGHFRSARLERLSAALLIAREERTRTPRCGQCGETFPEQPCGTPCNEVPF